MQEAPWGTGVAAGALYLATGAQLHRGDAANFLLETRGGLAHDPAHLLTRAVLSGLLAVTDRLLSSVSALTVIGWWAALGGALAAGLSVAVLRRQGVGSAVAVAATMVAVVSYAAWSTSVTFEGHAWPLALSLAAVWLLDGERPTRVVLAGVLAGGASALHVIASPVCLVLALQLGASWRKQALLWGAVAAVLQLGHGLTFLLPEPADAPPTHWLYPVAAARQAMQLAGTEAIAAGGPGGRWLAVAQGLGYGLVAPLSPHSRPWPWALLPLLALAGALWRRPAGWQLPAAWLVLALPLAAWVGPQNFEYYRLVWLMTLWLVALSLPRRRWTAPVLVVAALALGLANARVILRDRHSPTGEPAAMVERQGGPLLIDEDGLPVGPLPPRR